MSILDGATLAQIPWGSDPVQMIGLAPGVPLFRIFRHDNMDWEAPPEAFSNGRLDPPPGYKADFTTLYTAESALTGAFEVRAIRLEPGSAGERLVPARDTDPVLPPRQLVRHTVTSGALFVNLEDRPTARVFGLDPDAILDRVVMWQHAVKGLVDRLKADPPRTIAPVVGVAHQSKIRGSNGWNFGFLIPRHTGVLQRGTPEPLDLDQLARDLPGACTQRSKGLRAGEASDEQASSRTVSRSPSFRRPWPALGKGWRGRNSNGRQSTTEGGASAQARPGAHLGSSSAKRLACSAWST